MIDLDKVLTMCLAVLVAGLLVLATYLVAMRTASSDVDDWHEIAVSAQAATAQCLAVLEGVDADLISRIR
tara:strand:+ start:409 stop:618 length:210 start_codon:yes stop_codon:yes gene_type:complete